MSKSITTSRPSKGAKRRICCPEGTLEMGERLLSRRLRDDYTRQLLVELLHRGTVKAVKTSRCVLSGLSYP